MSGALFFHLPTRRPLRMTELVALDACSRPDRARAPNRCAALCDVGDVAAVERRAAAIAELTRRAGSAVPIQNEATFLRAEALERLAVLVDEGQAAGEIAKRGGTPQADRSPAARTLLRLPGAASADRGGPGRASTAPEHSRKQKPKQPRNPTRRLRQSDILKQAKRREREGALREQTGSREREAREVIRDFPNGSLRARPRRPGFAGGREGVASIVTDPPYVGDSIPLYEKLRDFAVDVLPDGGALSSMTWQAILPGVIRALEHDELAYRWTICWRYANTENTVDYARRVFDCWKPILVYHKGSDAGSRADAPRRRSA